MNLRKQYMYVLVVRVLGLDGLAHEFLSVLVRLRNQIGRVLFLVKAGYT